MEMERPFVFPLLSSVAMMDSSWFNKEKKLESERIEGLPLGKIGINDTFEPHFEEFKRAIEVGHQMECNRIRMFSFYCVSLLFCVILGEVMRK